MTLHAITPLWHSLPISRAAERPIHLKVEALQPCGSFKIRGVGRLCEDAAAHGAKGFVSSSGGNAGIATAYAGLKLGVPVTIFTFAGVPEAALERMRDYGAEVVLAGSSWDQAHLAASQHAAANRAVYVHPFDHPLIWDGHATLVDELVAEGHRPSLIVTSVGGGGLLIGVLEGLARHGLHPQVIAVETHGTASLQAALKADQLVRLSEIRSVAKTLGAAQVAEQAFIRAREYGVEAVTVSDEQALTACRRFALDHRLLVEPAAGAALAVAYERLGALATAEDALIVVCGGAGIALRPDIFAYT